MKTITLYILISISTLSTSCLFLSDDNIESELSKKEAEKRTKDGDDKDYCEVFSWYGDGQCDDFCKEPDTDCFTCDQPICEDGFAEVSACAREGIGYVCHESTQCGQTIYCEQTDLCLGDSILIECPANYHFVPTCDANSECIEIGNGCQGSYTCAKDQPTCLTLPSCGEGRTPVDRCRLDDETCRDVTLCGTTIFCTDNIICNLPPPTCAPDENSFPSQAECENSGSLCRQEYTCSNSIWCGGVTNCMAPECPPAERELPACDDAHSCYERSGCGQTIICATPI